MGYSCTVVIPNWHPRTTRARIRRLCAGRPVVITGAGSGMGRDLARLVAGAGVPVLLSDIDVVGLETTAWLCGDSSADVVTTVLDTTDREAVMSHADNSVRSHGAPSMVFNNAGITMVATILDEDDEFTRRIMAVNFGGVVHGTQAFLPHLRAAGGGHVVNTSSAFGLLGSPAQSSYSASKFAVRGFTETLQADLRAEGSPVRVHAVFPGAVHTAIARSARYVDTGVRKKVVLGFDHLLPGTRPAAAARAILAGILADRDRIMVGVDARAIDAAARLCAGALLRPTGVIARPLGDRVIRSSPGGRGTPTSSDM